MYESRKEMHNFHFKWIKLAGPRNLQKEHLKEHKVSQTIIRWSMDQMILNAVYAAINGET